MNDGFESKKRICVLAIRKKSSIFLAAKLKKILGDYAKIESLCFQDNLKEIAHPDLVVSAGAISNEKALEAFPNSKVVLAARNLSFVHLEKLCLLPKGKMVLFVNYSKSPTIEAISSLEKIGLNHLHYVPYWKDCKMEVKDFDTAISPGMLDICPEHITNRIDIGMRDIALSTYFKIIVSLDISPDIMDKLQNYYIQALINTYKRLNDERQRTEAININLHSILNELEEGFLFIDKDYKVSAANNSFERIVGMDRETIVGEKVEYIFRGLPGLANLLQPGLINKDSHLELKGESYYGSCIPLVKESGENFALAIRKVKESNKLRRSKNRIIYEKGDKAKWWFSDIKGESEAMRVVIEKARLISKTDSTVLITGESGTGKELFANAIHNESCRNNGPFIAVNFAALPESIAESELFGYEEGAFTGARKGGKAGLFELANGGSIFLDEIGDASLNIQKRLLRVLQEREIMRLGGTKRIPVDIRVIAATNRDLKNLIEKGLFREDLYFRLRVCCLISPPLRERKEDIPLLLEAFLSKYKVKKDMPLDVRFLMMNYDWPGNIRELENAIEYISNVSRHSSITVEDLPEEITRNPNRVSFANRTNNLINERDVSLYDLFNSDDILFLLKILFDYKCKNIPIGRKKLSDLALAQGKSLTEGKIRTRLRYMTNEGLVVIGKTKQGILITEKGERILMKALNE